MSSMLKKTGGLSFKPKAGRRPAGPSKPPPTTTPTPASNTDTPAPTIEPPPQTESPPPTTTPSNEAPDHVSNEPRPTTTDDSSQSTPQSQSEAGLPTVTIQPIPESSTIPSTTTTTNPTQEPEPTSQPVASNEDSQSDRTVPPEPTSDIPNADIQLPRETAEAAEASPIPPSTLTPNIHAQNRNIAAPPTAPPSPIPPSDTIAVVPSADEPAASDDVPTPTLDSTPAPKKRATRKRKAPATKTSTTSTDGSTPKVKRPRKKANKTATEDDATPANDEDETSVSQVKKVVRRRRRSPTPEDAENMTVDHTKTTVGELTKDLGIGKRFKHAEAIEERARQARTAYRMKKLERQKRKLGLLPEGEKDSESHAGTPAEGSENQDGSETAGADRGAGAGAAASGQGVGYEVIDGQIIINSQSLVVDRHAAQDMSTMETIEEDDFTNLTTSSSYRRESRRTGPNIWDDEETEKFYRLLKMFGTDFETIAAMFPGRSRRAIKLKFNREEVQRPRRLNAAIMVRGEKKVGIDIDEYKASQARWQTSDKILADHAKLVEEHNEHLKQLRDERIAAGLMDETELDDISSNNNNKGPGKDASAEIEEVDETEEAGDTAVQEEEIQDMGEAVPVPVPVPVA